MCSFVKLEVLTALKHLGCELTVGDKMFIQEEMSKFQNSTSSNGFNIPDTLDGFGENIVLLFYFTNVKLIHNSLILNMLKYFNNFYNVV